MSGECDVFEGTCEDDRVVALCDGRGRQTVTPGAATVGLSSRHGAAIKEVCGMHDLETQIGSFGREILSGRVKYQQDRGLKYLIS
jgi:hypothetical protein